jgi:hypothetical protein
MLPGGSVSPRLVSRDQQSHSSVACTHQTQIDEHLRYWHWPSLAAMSVARRNIVSGERAREGDGDLWKTILLWIPKDLRIGPKESEKVRCREVSGVVSAAPGGGGDLTDC